MKFLFRAVVCVFLVGAGAVMPGAVDAQDPPSEEAEDDATSEEQQNEEQPSEEPPVEEQQNEEQRPASSETATAPPATEGPTPLTIDYRQSRTEPPNTWHLVIPPLLLERSEHASTTAFFPLFWEKNDHETHELVIPPYYQRRSPEEDADVVFPFVWSYRGRDHATHVIPPFWWLEHPDGFDAGFAPFYLGGKHRDQTYTIIPPLLAFAYEDADEAYALAGPFWRIRSGQKTNWGVFPFLWVGEHEHSGHVVVPPFFFRLTDDETDWSLTVIPPFYLNETPTGSDWGIAPLLFHSESANSTSTTIPPLLFHYSEDPNAFRLVTPLFGYLREGTSETLVTPFYQRYRGATEMDAVAPFYFEIRDRRTGSYQLHFPPVFWHSEDPGGHSTVVAPFYGEWEEKGRYFLWATPLAARWQSRERNAEALWIFPTIQISHDERSSQFHIHPILYNEEAEDHRYTVVAPLFWDFEWYENRDRTTVFFPFYWRFQHGDFAEQVAFNTYYQEGRRRGVRHWEFHFLPFFSFGEDGPDSHWWNVFYGLVGYRRQGRFSQTTLFYIPFQTGGPPGP